MGSEECIHLLDPADCTICNGREKREKQAATFDLVGAEIEARYEGSCPNCRQPIEVGDSLRYSPGLGQYVHKQVDGNCEP